VTADQRRSTSSKKARDEEEKANDTMRLVASRSSARLITRLPLATKTGPARIGYSDCTFADPFLSWTVLIDVRCSQKEGRDPADARRATKTQPKSFKTV